MEVDTIPYLQIFKNLQSITMEERWPHSVSVVIALGICPHPLLTCVFCRRGV